MTHNTDTAPLPAELAQMVAVYRSKDDGSLHGAFCRETADMLTAIAAQLADRDAELGACTEHPGGCGYWRDRCKQREIEAEAALADLVRLTAERDELSVDYSGMELEAFHRAQERDAAEQRETLAAEKAVEYLTQVEVATARIAALTEALRTIHTRAISTRGDQAYREFPRFAEKTSRAALTTDKEST